MWLSVLICCAVASAFGDGRIATKLRPYSDLQNENVEAVTYRARSIPIEEFVSSRKVHVQKYVDEEEYDEDEEEEFKTEKLQGKKYPDRIENFEKKKSSLKENDRVHPKKQTDQDSDIIPGVYISNEYPTTMLPVLTTTREARSFDFIPVNIIREDSKDAYTPYSDRQFGDLSDVSLVPAGSSSRIQVKKGPNGKDYEYEYVYYYYDEDDEGKASSVSNTHEVPNKTTASPKRGTPNSNRSKYISVDRSTTVEPVSNEVIPNRNRGRQLAEADEVSEERLPANTRFPPRSRSNHNTGTTESSRVRGNRPRPSLELVDSSSFRTHQEGPEFPQNLPKGPVRFIGVTPNEDNEEKPSPKLRGRPHRVQEPAPVEEAVQDTQPIFRRRPSSNIEPETEVELNKGQPVRQPLNEDDVAGSAGSPHNSSDKKLHSTEKQGTESSDYTTTTDSPTTEYPSAMDKVALDLYAFLQQGQNNNLVDASADSDSSSESTTQTEDSGTTEAITTTETGSTTVITTESTTTTTEPSTTSTTTPEPTTAATTTTGRGKFRRPGAPGGAVSRNRFKANGGSTSTTESSNASNEPTQKVRGRFGANGNGGFKRPKPVQKKIVAEEIQKESAPSVNAEKPNGTRNRFRGTATRNVATSTPGPSSTPPAANPSTNSVVSRPSFNKLNINRRRGRPSTSAPVVNEETSEVSESDVHEATTTQKTSPRPRIPGVVPRPVRPGSRVNLRPRPGLSTSTTVAPEASEAPADEPDSEGTEEETHEAPAESSPVNRLTTANPFNKLRNRNRLQVQPKAATRSPIPSTPRRSPLLPRRKTTEAPIEEPVHEQENEEEVISETAPTEGPVAETSTAASTKHEEVRGLSGLLAPRRRIASRRPGQIISRE